MVQEGDTLSGIAERYGITEDIFAAYNEMTNPAEVQVGDTIRIPPAGYTIAETPDSQTSDTEAGSIESDTSSTTDTDKPFITDTDTQSTNDTEPASAKKFFC